MPGENAHTLSAQQLEADFDALLDLDAAARAAALAQIEQQDPERAQALRRWLGAVSASAGLLEPGSAPVLAVERVGPWLLDGLIGRGGSGEVYLGRRADGAFERQVAIKLLRADRNSDAQIVAERRLLARLMHPHIVGLLDGGVAADGRPYLVTEYVRGTALDAWLSEAQPDFDTRLRVFTALADAVAHAHANGVVHADLKPANILVDAEAQPRLLDFGIAQRLDQANDGSTGALHLTPAFAAPEQLDGKEATARTDVHALGLLLYLLFCERLPHADDTLSLAQLKARREQLDPPPPSSHPASRVPARRLRGDLDAIVLCCLEREPERRYPSVRALLDDLRAWRSHRPVDARRGSRAYRAGRYLRRHWLGGLGLGALAGLSALATWQTHAAHRAQQQVQALERVLTEIGATGDPAVVASIEHARARDWLARGEPLAAQQAAQAAVAVSRRADARSDALLRSLQLRARAELALADVRAVTATLAEIGALEPSASVETLSIRNELASLAAAATPPPKR